MATYQAGHADGAPREDQLKLREVILANSYNWKRDDFKFIKPIGKGGFGKVWLVQRKSDNVYFAIKEMYKARILAKRSIGSVINERKLLANTKHDFIVNMLYAF